MRSLVLAVVVVVGCGGKTPESSSSSSAESGAAPAPAPTPTPAPTEPADSAAPPAADPAPVSSPTKPPAGVDFIADAQRLYRVVACGGEGPLPEELAKYQKVVDKHCKALASQIAKYRKDYFVGARKWFDDHVPASIPSTLVYLFSGADLVSALVAFPNATEITTVSLELSGDPRRLPALTPAELASDLAAFRVEIGLLIAVGSNSSKNLASQQRRFLPGQVSSFLLGLHTGGYEPVAMRYFRIDEAGQQHYLEQSEIDADTKTTKSLRATWNKPSFAESFRNVELQFRKIGDTAVRTHRHIGWNMENKFLEKNPGLLRYLESKGKVTILVKGGSYLLWMDEFKTIRDYILSHLAWMLSDSTGPLPMHAKAAGLEQEPFGMFTGPIKDIFGGLNGSRQDADMRALFKGAKPMPFRFGYLDDDNHKHVIITRPK